MSKIDNVIFYLRKLGKEKQNEWKEIKNSVLRKAFYFKNHI